MGGGERKRPTGPLQALGVVATTGVAALILHAHRLVGDLVSSNNDLRVHYRWTVELFFRWFKCVLGCRQLLATNANGVALQVYAALIVSLLITLRTGRKPTKRTLEMLQLYLQGWATVADVLRHLDRLTRQEAKKTEG